MLEHIISIICQGENLTIDQVKKKTRKGEVVYARQLIMFFAVLMKLGTYAHIGKSVGGKDHATVMHAVKVINNYLDTDKQKRYDIQQYADQLGLLQKAYNTKA